MSSRPAGGRPTRSRTRGTASRRSPPSSRVWATPSGSCAWVAPRGRARSCRTRKACSSVMRRPPRSLYTGEIAKVMGMPTQDVVLYTRAGLLHDLGKLVMLDNILRKPRQLTEEEFEIVRTHPGIGDKILKPLRFLSCEAKAVRHHHERYDGKGYPDGIQGEDIPLIARV